MSKELGVGKDGYQKGGVSIEVPSQNVKLDPRAATEVDVNAKPGYKKGGRIKAQFGYNSGRTNLLEEVGRVEGERSNPNRRAELSRIHSELNRGLKKGGKS